MNDKTNPTIEEMDKLQLLQKWARENPVTTLPNNRFFPVGLLNSQERSARKKNTEGGKHAATNQITLFFTRLTSHVRLPFLPTELTLSKHFNMKEKKSNKEANDYNKLLPIINLDL